MDRILASERTRERLKSLIEGHSEGSDLRSEMVRVAARRTVAQIRPAALRCSTTHSASSSGLAVMVASTSSAACGGS
jgi:hypothetical protein